MTRFGILFLFVLTTSCSSTIRPVVAPPTDERGWDVVYRVSVDGELSERTCQVMYAVDNFVAGCDDKLYTLPKPMRQTLLDAYRDVVWRKETLPRKSKFVVKTNDGTHQSRGLEPSEQHFETVLVEQLGTLMQIAREQRAKTPPSTCQCKQTEFCLVETCTTPDPDSGQFCGPTNVSCVPRRTGGMECFENAECENECVGIVGRCV